jgi:hypothetical protein
MFDGPWEAEFIPNEDHVIRQVHHRDLVKKPKDRRFPNEAHFALHYGEDGLSVNWSKYCDENHCFVLIGLSHKINTDGAYKIPADYKGFKFNVGRLREVDGIDDVVHDPKFYGPPPQIGLPNNRAHTLVHYQDDEEIRLKLSDFVRDNYDEMLCNRNLEIIESEIMKLKSRIQDLQITGE